MAKCRISSRFMNPGDRSRYVQRVSARVSAIGAAFDQVKSAQGGKPEMIGMVIHVKTESGHSLELELSSEALDWIAEARVSAIARYGSEE